MREIAKSDSRRIKARLYLNAVLPAFEDLLHFSENARETIGKRKFNICFQTASGLRSSLHFKDQACSFQKSKTARSHIILHFVTEEQVNKEFENRGIRIPLPIKGATRINDMKAFKALSKQLEASLRPKPEKLEDTNFHDFHVGLQLGIALRAVVELATHEVRSKRIMTETPEGIAYFSVGAEGYGAWLEWKGGKLKAGKGQPDREPDVDVTFSNAKTALKAVGNRIDVMAAVGLGEIKVTGLAPLADALGYIFERIPLYIEP
jgi:hypothetical protein